MDGEVHSFSISGRPYTLGRMPVYIVCRGCSVAKLSVADSEEGRARLALFVRAGRWRVLSWDITVRKGVTSHQVRALCGFHRDAEQQKLVVVVSQVGAECSE